MKIAEIKNRWETLNDDILVYLKKGMSFRDYKSPFPDIDEMLDYRGVKWSGQLIKDNSFINIDFSHGDFSSTHFENCVFSNCIFKKVNLDKIIDGNNIFSNVIFENCKFTGASLGFEGSQYDNVFFDKANFGKTIFIRPEFNNTSFLNCKLKNLDFNGSSFRDCNFVGLLDDCWFRGGFASQEDNKRYGAPRKNDMLNVSFEKAIFNYVEFSNGCDLSTTVLPTEEGYYRFDLWNQRLEFLKNESSSWEADLLEASNLFYKTHNRFSSEQNWYILNADELKKRHDETIAETIVETLNKF